MPEPFWVSKNLTYIFHHHFMLGICLKSLHWEYLKAFPQLQFSNETHVFVFLLVPVQLVLTMQGAPGRCKHTLESNITV